MGDKRSTIFGLQKKKKKLYFRVLFFFFKAPIIKLHVDKDLCRKEARKDLGEEDSEEENLSQLFLTRERRGKPLSPFFSFP